MVMDLDVAEVHKYTKDKLLKAKFTHLDQTSLVNEGYIIWLKGYFCGTQRVI